MKRSDYILELVEGYSDWCWILYSGKNYTQLATSDYYTTKNNALKTMKKLAKSLKGTITIKGGE